MKDETLDAVEMTRAIRDAMYEATKDLGTDELILFFKESARRARRRAESPGNEERQSKA